MNREILLLLLIMLFSAPVAAELLAQTSTGAHTFRVEKISSIGDTGCQLNIVAKNFTMEDSLLINEEYYGCDAFKSKLLIGYYDWKVKSSIVFFETYYGGDGDNIGPVLKVFSAGLSGENANLQSLGRYELSDISYIKSKGIFSKISGERIISLCLFCDSWEVAEPDDIFHVPVTVEIDGLKLTQKVELSPGESRSLLDQIASRITYLKSEESGAYLDERNIVRIEEMYSEAKTLLGL